MKNEEITLNKEGYELNFLGKSYAMYLSLTKTQTFIATHTEHNEKDEELNWVSEQTGLSWNPVYREITETPFNDILVSDGYNWELFRDREIDSLEGIELPIQVDDLTFCHYESSIMELGLERVKKI